MPPKPRMRSQVKPARLDAADGRRGAASIPGDATVQGRGSVLDRRDALMKKREEARLLDRRDALMRRREAETRLRQAKESQVLDRRDALMRAREQAKASEETRRRLRAKGLIK
jgi:hypothetical protein